MFLEAHQWLNRWIFEHGRFRDDAAPTPANANLSLKAYYPVGHSLEHEVVGASTFSCFVDINCEAAGLMLHSGELPLLFRHWCPIGRNQVRMLTTPSKRGLHFRVQILDPKMWSPEKRL